MKRRRLMLPFALPWVLGCLILACLTLTGCGQRSNKLPTDYGKRTGEDASSVNGTKALSEMFREAGYYVRSFGSISPSTLRHDVIIWFPSDYNGPDAEMRSTVLNWLDEEEGRTFIIVGRDYDAAIQYWDEVIPQVPPAEKLNAMRQRSQAIRDFDLFRSMQAESGEYGWYSVERHLPRREPKQFIGPWADGIDAAKTEIVLHSKMKPTPNEKLFEQVDIDDELIYLIDEQEVLLGTDEEPIVVRWTSESEYSANQVLLVNNGSFLLNLPLVNPEHRKLAGELINQCDSVYTPDSVAFLETQGTVRILSADDSAEGKTGWEWLERWPLNLVGLQLAWWLIVLCFALYPIFGRAKRLPMARTSDFKKHIDSVGDLLEATDDHAYAQLRLQQYQQVMKGEAVYRRSRSRRTDGK